MAMIDDRRAFLARLAATGTGLWAAAGTHAAPTLSATNFGLDYARATRTNCWMEVDAAGFERNIAQMRALVGPGTQVCAVLKADAYGHGLALLVPSLKRAGIHWLGIASNDEARVARTLGFAGRILRLRSATRDEVEDAMPNHVEELVGNADTAGAMARIAQRHGRRLKIHFVLNSGGMSRNGLELGEAAGKSDAGRIFALHGLDIVGIMSHFPVEDAADMRAGAARFAEESAWLMAATQRPRSSFTLHLANSYGTLNVPEARLDMVRTGGALLGDTDPAYSQFQRIRTVKSRVVSINHYPAGNTVTYDRTYRLTRDSWLANIPVGYSDGFRRVLSHGNQPEPDKTQAYVLIRGQRLPVVGRVTMNTVMVDATDAKDAIALGDEVVLYGRQGGDEITQADLENLAHTNADDLLTVWGNSLPKVLKPAHA